MEDTAVLQDMGVGGDGSRWLEWKDYHLEKEMFAFCLE